MSAERLSQCPAAWKSGRLHSTKLKINPPNQIDDHDHQQTRMAGVPNRGGTANNRPRTGVSTSGGRPTTAQNHNNNNNTWWMMTCTLTKNGKKKKGESVGGLKKKRKKRKTMRTKGCSHSHPTGKLSSKPTSTTTITTNDLPTISTTTTTTATDNLSNQLINKLSNLSTKPANTTTTTDHSSSSYHSTVPPKPETRLRKLTNGTPNSTGMNSRGFSSAIPLQTANSVEDAPVIELRSGFNNASRRAAAVQEGDRDSLKSGSSHSLHKVDYIIIIGIISITRFILNSNRNSTFRMKEMGGLENYNIEDSRWIRRFTVSGSTSLSVEHRYPEMHVSRFEHGYRLFFVVIISYPSGKLCATILPDEVYRLPGGGDGLKRTGFKGFLDKIWPRWLGAGTEWSLNPGPFNIKEHTVIAIMANAAVGPVYAVNMTLVMEKYYQRPPGPGFDFCIAIATQLLGFALAGLTRRFLIWPASMIWPSNLVVCTLLNTFHAEDDDGSDGSLTRFRFFMYVAVGAFVWYWIPGYLFTALSTFSWVCWLAPRNRLLNQMFGTVNGLGLSLLTFDWSQIAYIGSPLVVPWWAEVNVIIGFIFFFYILGPILYYSNTWSQAYLPLGGTGVYDRYGQPYNTTKVVDLKTGSLNLTAYQEYSPLFLPTTFTAVYSIAFALATSAIVHTALYHGHSIWDKIKNIKTEDEDVHAKLMRNYPEVPDWWYWSYFLVFTIFSIIMIEVYDTGLPIWGLLLALFIALAYVLPGIHLRYDYNMLFKTFSVQSLLVGLAFIQDLKLGHYMKIPPRVTFVVQIVAAILSAFVQIAVKKFLVATVPDLCDKHQANLLTCPNTSVFYSASVLWGLLGPHRQFGEGTIYRPILVEVCQFTGLTIRSMLDSTCNAYQLHSWILVGFIFQYVLRRMKFRWWSKYNFVLSAGLDVGTVIGAIVIFFTLQLPKGGQLGTLNWWGNTVYLETDDFEGTPYLDPPAEGFGPLKW
ncbi:hypothetical protein KEM48_012153 [Puccinia striiformis f. sp. tritici PST-130]|nr:hypothetical protein KEM48_012153 [Puccinia striiformis f. sp. tritici PST-130]